jgi:hypothetical protein
VGYAALPLDDPPAPQLKAVDCEFWSRFRKSCRMLLTSLLVLLDEELLDDVPLVEDDVLASDSKSSIENPVPVEDELPAEEVLSLDNKISIVKPPEGDNVSPAPADHLDRQAPGKGICK